MHEAIFTWLGIQYHIRIFFQTLKWIRSRFKGSRVQRKVALAAVAAIVYKIWQTRNESYWLNKVNFVDKVVKDIQHMVKSRIAYTLGCKAIYKIKLGFKACDFDRVSFRLS